MAADGRCSASSLLHLPQQRGATRRPPATCSCSGLRPQLSPVQLWSRASSRYTCAWAGAVLRAGTSRPQQPLGRCSQRACVLPKVFSVCCAQCLRGESTTFVTRQLRLRFLRRSDGSQIFSAPPNPRQGRLASHQPGFTSNLSGYKGHCGGLCHPTGPWHIPVRAEPRLWQLAQTMLPGTETTGSHHIP